MFRCNQCTEDFQDESSVKRHLSIKHLRYFPYLCNYCEESGEIYSAATEEDMDKHVGKMHPGTDTSINTVKIRFIEAKLKVLIEECRLTGVNHDAMSSQVTQKRDNSQTMETTIDEDDKIFSDPLPKRVKIEDVTTDSVSHHPRAILSESTIQPCVPESLPVTKQLQKSKPMQFFFLTLSRKPISLMVSKDDTVATVKEKIQEIEGIPKDEFYLTFSVLSLADEKTLSEYNIEKENTRLTRIRMHRYRY